MTWTARLVEVAKRDSMVWATVVFESDNPEDAVLKQTQCGDTLDADAIALWVAYKLQSLNSCDVAFTSAKSMGLGPVEPAVIPPSDFQMAAAVRK